MGKKTGHAKRSNHAASKGKAIIYDRCETVVTSGETLLDEFVEKCKNGSPVGDSLALVVTARTAVEAGMNFGKIS